LRVCDLIHGYEKPFPMSVKACQHPVERDLYIGYGDRALNLKAKAKGRKVDAR
jgi:hypothetical protein